MRIFVYHCPEAPARLAYLWRIRVAGARGKTEWLPALGCAATEDDAYSAAADFWRVELEKARKAKVRRDKAGAANQIKGAAR